MATVTAGIQWKDSPLEFSAQAVREDRIVLIYFFDPACDGCKAFDATTLSHSCVQEYIEKHFAPVRLDVPRNLGLYERYNFCWTPTVLMQDGEGREHRRCEGAMPPEAFLRELALARLKEALNGSRFETARELSFEVLRTVEKDPQRAPECLYWCGVANFRAGRSVELLNYWWTRLLDEYPSSDWAARAQFIRKKA
jgi:hypothetical protein